MYIVSFSIAERSLVEARDVQGASFLPITPPIVVSEEEVDDIQRDSPVDSGEAGTSTQNFTAIHSKGNRTDRKDSTSGKRSHDDGKKNQKGVRRAERKGIRSMDIPLKARATIGTEMFF